MDEDELFRWMSTMANRMGWELSMRDPGPDQEGCEVTWADTCGTHLCQLAFEHVGLCEDRGCFGPVPAGWLRLGGVL